MSRKGSPIISTVILALIGLMVIGIGVFASFNEKNIKDHGVDAKATVVNKDETIEHHTDYETHNGHRQRHERNERKYYLFLDFADASGAKHDVKRSLGKSVWDKHEKGEIVDIKYLPDDPKTIRLATEVAGDPMTALYICGGIGGFIILGAGGYFFWCLKTGKIM